MKRATVTGRHARYYMVLYSDIDGIALPRDFTLVVTYHRSIRGTMRQLTLSDKLLGRVLREPIP